MFDLEGRKIHHQDHEQDLRYLIVTSRNGFQHTDQQLKEIFCRQTCGVIRARSVSLLIHSDSEINYETGKVRPAPALLVYPYNRTPADVRGNTGYFIYGPTLEDVETKLASVGMDDFFRIRNAYESSYKPEIRRLLDLFEYTVIITLSLLTVLSSGYLLVKSYYDVHQKRLMIEKMHGYSFVRRHRRFWLASLIIFGGYLLGLHYFQKVKWKAVIDHFPWLLIVALFLLSLLLIRDRKKMATIMKGETS